MSTMRQGICPECKSTDIYTRKGWFNNIVTFFQPPRTRVYVCATCGYVREYIDAGHLPHIRENWDEVKTIRRKRDQQLDDTDEDNL